MRFSTPLQIFDSYKHSEREFPTGLWVKVSDVLRSTNFGKWNFEDKGIFCCSASCFGVDRKSTNGFVFL